MKTHRIMHQAINNPITPPPIPSFCAGRKSQRTMCLNCGVHSTPQWRCGPLGPRTLCNACGVRFKKGLPLNCWPIRDRMRLPVGAVLPPDVVVPEGITILYTNSPADEA